MEEARRGTIKAEGRNFPRQDIKRGFDALAAAQMKRFEKTVTPCSGEVTQAACLPGENASFMV